MNKQQFLAMSIFSNLKYLDDNNKIVELHCIDNGIGLVNFGWGDAKEFTKVKPIVRPYSDLTKEIEHNGEKIIPIVELAKLIHPNHEWKLCAGLYASVGNGYMTFEYDNGYDCFLSNNSAQLPQTKCLLKLLEWRFDIADLLETKEAVDYHTLPDFVF